MPGPHQNLFRTERTTHYTVLPNALLRDKRLSFKARGILALIFTNVDEWEVHQGWITEQGTEGREAVSSAMKELEGQGYAVYAEIRDGGRYLKNVWTFYDQSVAEDLRTNRTRWREQPPQDGKPCHGLPCDGKPCHGNPYPKKEDQTEDHQTEAQGAFALFPEPEAPATEPKARAKKHVVDFTLPAALATPEIQAAWDMWITHRREKRMPLTPTSTKLQVAQLVAMGPGRALAALLHSSKQGYQGIYEPKTETNNGRGGPSQGRNVGTHNEGRANQYSRAARADPNGQPQHNQGGA